MENQSHTGVEEAQKVILSPFSKRNRRRTLKKIHKNITKLDERVRSYLYAETPHLETFKLYENIGHLQSIPKAVLSLSLFENYSSAQLILLKNGTSEAKSYFFNKNSGASFNSISSDEFHGVFNIIKRSHHIQFDQTVLLKEVINLSGYFVAHAFSLDYSDNKCKALLLIGQDAFIPFSQQDIENFMSLYDPIKRHILESINSSSNQDNTLFLALEAFPFPLAIFDERSNITFQNDDFDKTLLSSYRNNNGAFITVSLTQKYTLTIAWKEKDASISEISHQYNTALLKEMISTLKYDLSSPLYKLELAANMFSRMPIGDCEIEALNDIQKGVKTSQTILENLESLYNNSANFKNVKLMKLIKDIVTLAKSEIVLINKELSFNNIDEHFVINTSTTWLTQIIFNLIINSSHAIKESNESIKNHKINITCTYDKKLSKIFITIADTGPGIKEEDKNKIFTPFFTTKKSGTGLGLPICKALASKLGGEITFTSKPLVKTEFILAIDANR